MTIVNSALNTLSPMLIMITGYSGNLGALSWKRSAMMSSASELTRLNDQIVNKITFNGPITARGAFEVWCWGLCNLCCNSEFRGAWLACSRWRTWPLLRAWRLCEVDYRCIMTLHKYTTKRKNRAIKYYKGYLYIYMYFRPCLPF